MEYYQLAGKKHFVSLKLECQSGGRTRDVRPFNQTALTTAPDALPCELRWGLDLYIPKTYNYIPVVRLTHVFR